MLRVRGCKEMGIVNGVSAMAFIKWSDRFLTGIQKIDNDHQHLFEIVNAIHGVSDSKARLQEAEPLILSLPDYAGQHFEREEVIMRNCAFPGYSQHAEKHRSILRRLQARVDRYSSLRRDLDFEEFLSFASNWLVSHVLKSDMEFVPYLSENLQPLAKSHVRH